MKGQTVDLGVFVNHSQLKTAVQNRYGFEYLPFYADAARKMDLRLIFFSEQSYLKENLLQAYEWNPDTQQYERGIFQIPFIIHNRALHLHKQYKIHSALKTQQVHLYNGANRFDKWDVHRRLQKNPDTAKYLPETTKLQAGRQIREMLQKYGVIYLKPRSGSLGLGIIRLREIDDRLEVSQTIHGRSQHKRVSLAELASMKAKFGKRPYLIQQGISLIRVEGQPVDFRVSVQKGANGDWVVSGIVAKVGAFGAHATNLAVGGEAMSALHVLKKIFVRSEAKRLYRAIAEASLQIAQQLEGLAPNMADLGLDMTVTRDGEVKFIEANGRDLRITFRNAKQHKMWRHTFQTPILYGSYLLNQTALLQQSAYEGNSDELVIVQTESETNAEAGRAARTAEQTAEQASEQIPEREWEEG